MRDIVGAGGGIAFMKKRLPGDRKAAEWAEAIPLASAKDLKSYH